MTWHPLLSERPAATAALLLIAALAWLLLRLWASRLTDDLELRQKLRGLSTLLVVLLLPGGLLLLWSAKVHQTLLALTAFSVAIVLAFKELLLNLIGGLYRLATQPYDIGDRIEIADRRGDVVDLGLLSTSLLEVGPGQEAQTSTGRMLHLPHSLLLSHPVVNATETGFRWHEIVFKPAPSIDPDELTAALLEIAEAEHAENRAELDAAVETLRRKVAYRPPPATPFVFAAMDEKGGYRLTLRYAVRSRQQRLSEDRLVRALLARFGPGLFGGPGVSGPERS